MPEYINNNNHTVYLPGPDGKTIQIKSREKKHLNDFFDRYCARGYITKIQSVNETVIIPQKQNTVLVARINQQKQPQPKHINTQASQKQRAQIQAKRIQNIVNKAPKIIKPPIGRRINVDATDLLKQNIAKCDYAISNNIGIGILSYNRAESFKRLIESIVRYTDLRKTTIFISDDNSDDQELLSYYQYLLDIYQHKFIIIRNNERLGIAGNSNRLLNCLSRFKYGMLLNDDVEIIKDGWDSFYFDHMKRSGFNHYIYRQEGVYGAEVGLQVDINGIIHLKTDEKPHGAVLAFTNKCIKECGYFNEEYGMYGMEHVDWSTRIYEMGLQQKGYFDLLNSNKYFVIHKEKTIIDDKSSHLKHAKEVHKNRVSEYVECSYKAVVPKISYVIPVRNIDRGEAIKSVINNIRAQAFPNIEIVISEHDNGTHINVEELMPITYCLVHENTHFNKSKAFNKGVSLVTSDSVILHDADTIVQRNYASTVFNILNEYEACHLGKTVIYTCNESAKTVYDTSIVDERILCERVVGYYEGGSLACKIRTYWKIGAFNENFVGYGCEDTEFYNRLSKNSKWLERREFDLVHLWHSRTDGWGECHTANKAIEAKLYGMPMDIRLNAQYKQLSGKYNEQISKATKND
jgi:GT2 family glycosyltransferase